MKTAQGISEKSQAAIFSRLWETESGELSPIVARALLKLQFPAKDQARMHELAEKNKMGAITADELEELDNYITTGDLVALLQSKARQTLRNSDSTKHG